MKKNQLHVIPEVNNNKVFNKGNEKISKVKIFIGGQTLPTNILGEILELKNAQKKAKKSIISDSIKSVTPLNTFVLTIVVYIESKFDSLTTVHDQSILKITTKIKQILV